MMNVERLASTKQRSKRPLHTRFSQQELPALKPILTPKWIILVLIGVGIFFIPLGIASMLASDQVVEIVQRYDENCIPVNEADQKIQFIQDSTTNKTCTMEIIVPKHMNAPVFVYYQLDEYYQNHRRYVKSRSDMQLTDSKNEDDVFTCEPEDKTSITKKPIVPCGLVAWSLFNDTYKFSLKNKDLPVNTNNIAWDSDTKRKYNSHLYPKNFQTNESQIGGGQLDETKPITQQEHFLVWMRTAAFPTFRKLYGRIETDLEANDMISVVIENNYNTYLFDGKKMLVLSTTTWIGGKHDFLGLAFLIGGGVSLFFSMAFIVLYLTKRRNFGDAALLSWNKAQAGRPISI